MKSSRAWGASLPIACSDLESMQHRQVDIEQNQVRLQFFGLAASGLQPIRRLEGLELRPSLKRRTSDSAERRIVLDDENPQRHMAPCKDSATGIVILSLTGRSDEVFSPAAVEPAALDITLGRHLNSTQAQAELPYRGASQDRIPNGRTFSVTVSAKDKAGNSGSRDAVVRVPLIVSTCVPRTLPQAVVTAA